MLEIDKNITDKYSTRKKSKTIHYKQEKSIPEDEESIVLPIKKEFNLDDEVNISDLRSQKEDNAQSIFSKIKKFYVAHSSRPSYAETAKRFNVNVSMIAEIAKEEDWFGQREYYWAKKQADQLEELERSNENVFKSLSAVVQISLKEHAMAAIAIEKQRNKDKNNNRVTEVTYNLREVMAMVKVLKEMSSVMQEQVDRNNKSLREMTDSELLSRVSEDEFYDLDLSWIFGKDNKDEERIEDVLLVQDKQDVGIV